jgi:TetR/AcrR family transcriptional repressor of lmrAB and yxaGH operons
MAKPGTARERLVDTAMRLFGRRGYAAIGLNEIVDKSGAPKGSLYHYFPDGKEQLAVAALAHGSTLFLATVNEALETNRNAAEAVRRIGTTLAGWMEGSKFRDGSPATAVTVEMAAISPAIRSQCQAGFASWQARIAATLARNGVPATEARDLALWVVASLEGAMVLARAEASAQPIRNVTRLLVERLEAAIRPAAAPARASARARTAPRRKRAGAAR